MTDETPARLVIGVTGHRTLEDEATLRKRIRFVLLSLSQRASGSPRRPVPVTALSAIAEGADRVVAEEVLQMPNGSLEVVLPFPKADYVTDFETDASKAAFNALLARASDVRELEAGASRDEGYENGGRTIVDACDVLIAVWDGEPSRGRGGTAEIVDYARTSGKEVVWIGSAAPHLVHDEGAAATSAETDDYNAYLEHHIDERAQQEQTRKQRGWWTPSDPAAASELPLDALMDWILPEFVRADMLALRYQRRHQRIGDGMFALPVIAVGTVTSQALFAPQWPQLMLIEVAALLALLAGLGFSRRTRLHSRWISYRFLAERLRSSYFLAVIGSTDQRRDQSEVAYLDDPSDEWIRLTIAEVNGRRPALPMTDTYVAQARDYLAQYWIHDQSHYHRKASARNSGHEHVFQRSIRVLFILALAVALVHSFSEPESAADRSHVASVLIQLSIVVPVIGAALHGISTQREFKRHAQRYERMAKLLDGLQTRMCEASDAGAVAAVASEVEHLIRDENSDWFGVMRFHDVELIT